MYGLLIEMNNPIETKTTTGVCAACNYDLQGVIPNEQGQTLCPECGTPGSPSSINLIFTKKMFHRHFLLYFTIPTTLSTFCVLVLSFLPYPIGSVITVFYLLFALLFIPIIYTSVSAAVFTKSLEHPRPTYPLLVPLWGLLYSLPVVGLCILLMWRYSLNAIQV